jgi:hypothetical protein
MPAQVPQLVRIARHVNRNDPAVLDLRRRRLQHAAALDGDKAGQAVDELKLPDSFFFDPLPEEELELWEKG